MRLSNLSFFVQALLLTAVAAQSAGVSNPVQDVTTDTTSSSTSVPETTSTTSSTSSSETTSEESTTKADPTTTTTSSSSSEPTTDPATTDPTTSPEPSSTPEPTVTSTTSKKTDPASKTSTEGDNTTSSKTTTTQTPVVKTITSYATSDGSTIANVMTTTSTPASEPSLNGDKGSGSSGVSSSDKKIIIGVVVGVGGAILIGAVGLVFWRIHKKRSEQYGDEDDLMGGTAVGSGPREKAPSPAGNTPFKNTLDQYHNPGPVNAASNF
ncbi:Mid2-like cell wall stress sensor [Penicillium robsamsonii]|uniref:Mid2-like cell wall stress sensor n=1 Tax=Penicillium robsamsonii TaxID=1792511 RepID=UPI0025489F36|nr:Mid2-like cell wall stress sensor [Penicillium robsamsonii]KAJ5835009.1 Mid2-like cell wall stress sensor [Penicillium robsamsonii]